MSEAQRVRIISNENSQALKTKHQRLQQPAVTTNRVALGNVSTNASRISRTSLDKPSQKIKVFGDENDENKAPAGVENTERYTTSEYNRQPLADIKNRYVHKDQDADAIKVYQASEYKEEASEVYDEEDVDEDAIPEPLMPELTPKIHQELMQVYDIFHSDKLDEEDEDTFDVSMVAEYSPEIFNYLHGLEIKMRPNPGYMKNQTELKWNMRSILVDWLVQVHSRFNLLPETLFLTVNYIDRFLSRRRVSLSRFQLVGAVALFIAAKYEEINCPSVQEIAYMVDHAYTVEDILRAERFMIDVLEFEMGWPGPMSFLRRTSKADDYDFETRTLAKYFLEITVMDYRFVASPPSWLAASAHFLSRLLLNRGEWTPAHVYYSGYTAEQLRPAASVLLEACRNPEEHHKSIFEKYQERRYRRSSLFVQEWIKVSDGEQ
ncbi:G2/mitotic-specific cyclin-B1 [Wickerhamomyces ciferrii]|uniref:G2/mitotic-specific cyclin-B1 n=1 Tax=Wickerhamomyces ciferrii (strain ATCC 14091 / BCRC 22168 / CBS 111 / JCM 3599 / NBRC 0793 / NRRL Y-1031 F-60-10) TaxID=1206466 RepID=K0KCI4_WICCF|nr:G2/mitotic-specific cyclin-B1 [Wickerhamomyces ciferrii]CCH40611.1 G2/mitotic-specific cyclin-B1 [Wickerhamomyces ciferrii]